MPAWCWPRSRASTSRTACARDPIWRPARQGRSPYDTLIVAGGSRYSFFGHDEWRAVGAGPSGSRGAGDAAAAASRPSRPPRPSSDAERRAAWLTFVVVGGGPTGVEMAGQIAELARERCRASSARRTSARRASCWWRRPIACSGRFRRGSRRRPLAHSRGSASRSCSERQSRMSTPGRSRAGRLTARSRASRAHRHLGSGRGGVRPRRNARRRRRRAARPGRAGRGAPGLTVHGRDEVIALGDMVSVHDGEAAHALPGLATVAMQQGRYAARVVRRDYAANSARPSATSTRGTSRRSDGARAVADIKGVQLSGFLAWMTWLAVHIFYLIGVQNRLLVFTRWSASFLTDGRSSRIITTIGAPATGDPVAPERPLGRCAARPSTPARRPRPDRRLFPHARLGGGPLGKRHTRGRNLRMLDPVATRISLVRCGGKRPCSTTPGVSESRVASWSGSSTGPR